MAITEAFSIMGGLWQFTKTFFKAVIIFLNDNNAPKQHELKGQGIAANTPLPEKLPSSVDIKRAIPKRCFQPTVRQSMHYVLKDVAQVIICYFVFASLHAAIPMTYWPTMVLYWAIQGTYFTAIFVVGHDCGHDSFSHYTFLNDVVGQILHSFLLCPYYTWKMSHRQHHKNNANLEKDELFYPITESSRSEGETRQYKYLPGFAFGLGWFVYLVLGYGSRAVSHLNPFDPMFAGHLWGCFFTMGGMSLSTYLIYLYYLSHGFLALFNYYLVPLLVFGSYILILVFLHHTEMNIPWYADDEWESVRGQLSAVDRHYGIVHNVTHNIGTHQMHHMFTKIPHYRLEEATSHFRAEFPDLVRTCEEPILPSFFRMFKKFATQSVVKDDTKIHYYK